MILPKKYPKNAAIEKPTKSILTSGIVLFPASLSLLKSIFFWAKYFSFSFSTSNLNILGMKLIPKIKNNTPNGYPIECPTPTPAFASVTYISVSSADRVVVFYTVIFSGIASFFNFASLSFALLIIANIFTFVPSSKFAKLAAECFDSDSEDSVAAASPAELVKAPV